MNLYPSRSSCKSQHRSDPRNRRIFRIRTRETLTLLQILELYRSRQRPVRSIPGDIWPERRACLECDREILVAHERGQVGYVQKRLVQVRMGLRTRLRRWAVVVRHGVSGEGGKESGRRVGGLALDARRGGICRVENEVEGAVGHDAKRARDDGEQVERKRSRACLCNRLLINSAIDANSILAWRRCRPPSRKPRFPLDSIRNNCALS